eukprot:scaffold111035_cov21-Tisochrysis_lutea.AAC.3
MQAGLMPLTDEPRDIPLERSRRHLPIDPRPNANKYKQEGVRAKTGVGHRHFLHTFSRTPGAPHLHILPRSLRDVLFCCTF